MGAENFSGKSQLPVDIQPGPNADDALTLSKTHFLPTAVTLPIWSKCNDYIRQGEQAPRLLLSQFTRTLSCTDCGGLLEDALAVTVTI